MIHALEYKNAVLITFYSAGPKIGPKVKGESVTSNGTLLGKPNRLFFLILAKAFLTFPDSPDSEKIEALQFKNKLIPCWHCHHIECGIIGLNFKVWSYWSSFLM